MAATKMTSAGTMSSAQECNVAAIKKLWKEREESGIRDLPIGPGDVVDVTASEIDELQNEKARVSPEGTIDLPLIGTVDAAGLSENELREAIVKRLLVYMKQPRVELYVENYRSRGVDITGAVQKPGAYDMSETGDSMMDLMGLAGGLASGASQQIILFPVTSRSSARSLGQSPPSAGQVQSASLRPDIDLNAEQGKNSDSPYSIAIDLTAPAGQACLGIPMRPGDVVVVPVAGEVMVQGWVNNPGAFPITPNMTVLSAVSAAGGATFSWHAELIRPGAYGSKTITEYSLSKLEDGEQPDALVRSGDVVLVQKSVVGAVPYAIYSIFTRFGSGLALPVL